MATNLKWEELSKHIKDYHGKMETKYCRLGNCNAPLNFFELKEHVLYE